MSGPGLSDAIDEACGSHSESSEVFISLPIDEVVLREALGVEHADFVVDIAHLLHNLADLFIVFSGLFYVGELLAVAVALPMKVAPLIELEHIHRHLPGQHLPD
jgi:hypothetical protein